MQMNLVIVAGIIPVQWQACISDFPCSIPVKAYLIVLKFRTVSIGSDWIHFILVNRDNTSLWLNLERKRWHESAAIAVQKPKQNYNSIAPQSNESIRVYCLHLLMHLCQFSYLSMSWCDLACNLCCNTSLSRKLVLEISFVIEYPLHI